MDVDIDYVITKKQSNTRQEFFTGINISNISKYIKQRLTIYLQDMTTLPGELLLALKAVASFPLLSSTTAQPPLKASQPWWTAP